MPDSDSQLIYHEYHPFYDMCWMAAQNLTEAEAELAAIHKEFPEEKLPRKVERQAMALVDEIHMNSIAAPVFALMAAEQLIFVYAARRMTKFKVALEHIDRLDTEAKWRVILPMVCGNELRRDSKALADLRLLTRYRNSFVHPKPVIISNLSDEKIMRLGQKVEGVTAQRYPLAKRAPTVLIHLAEELCQTDRHRTVRSIVRDAGIPLPVKPNPAVHRTLRDKAAQRR
ncbi:MAG: hypothetical protein WAO76_05560 [Georgfuchsia sp.]